MRGGSEAVPGKADAEWPGQHDGMDVRCPRAAQWWGGEANAFECAVCSDKLRLQGLWLRVNFEAAFSTVVSASVTWFQPTNINACVLQ